MALCAETDPALFFPEVGESKSPAKDICASCDELPDCLRSIFQVSPDIAGIRGAMSVTQREDFRHARDLDIFKYLGEIGGA